MTTSGRRSHLRRWLPVLALAAGRAAAGPPSPTVSWSASAAPAAAPDPEQAPIGAGAGAVFVRTLADGAVVELDAATGRRLRALPRGRCPDTDPLDAHAAGRVVIVHGAGSYTRDERASDGRGPGCPEEVWAVARGTGRTVWSRALPGHSADARVLADGRGCLVASDTAIEELALGDGRIRWRARLGDPGPIVGDGPRVVLEAGLALSGARVFFVDDPDGQGRSFRLVGLDRASGRRRWRTPLAIGCAHGATFSGLAAADGVVAVGWTCRTDCHTGHTCPAGDAHAVAVHAADGRILWERAFPGAEVDHLAAGGGALLLVEDARALVALELSSGAPRWRAAFPRTTGEDGLVVDGGQAVAWSGDAESGAPVLLGLDLRSGAVAWRWSPPPVPGDWAVPWLGPWPVGGQLVVGDHRSVSALRVPGATRR